MGVKIREPSYAHLRPAALLGIVLFVYFGIQICSCSITRKAFNKIGNTRLTKSHATTESVSAIACCSECNVYSWCRSLSYKPLTNECQLSDIGSDDIDANSRNNNKWVTYVKNNAVCNSLLVSGPNGIKDSQLTQSSFYSTSSSDKRLAKFARLNSIGIHTGAWSAQNGASIDEYVQADFVHVKRIVAVLLQGRSTNQGWNGAMVQYVTRFRILTSLDCLTFIYIADKLGHGKMFDGNSHPEQIVTRYMQRGGVLARCVRINPVAWYDWPSLRFDVLGC